LTVHPGMILVNNELDAQFFMYIYLYSLRVSGSHVPIIRRVTVSMRRLVYSLCVDGRLVCIPLCVEGRLVCVLDVHLHRVK